MSVMREIPPTAGFALPARELFAAWNRSRYPGGLEKDFSSYLDASYARVVCSGTAGLYYMAAAVKDLSDRNTVLISAYTCPSVVLAIARAGLKIHVCDVNADNFDYDIDELAGILKTGRDIAAVVITHLGGIAAGMDNVVDLARKNNVLVIEDCAQSLGAEYHGRKVGTIGDMAFFSLARGKGLTLYEGGVVVAGAGHYADRLDKKIRELEKEMCWEEARTVFKLAGYAFFYRPQLFWWVYRLPELFWYRLGQQTRALSEHFVFDFPVQKVSAFRKSVGHAAFGRLEDAISRQRCAAERYMGMLEGVEGVRVLREPSDTRATFPYLTLILDEDRVKELMPLKNLGLGVSELFSAAIPDYEYLKSFVRAGGCPRARSLSRRTLTLSTSLFLTEKDAVTVCELIKK